jgi:hypothetical protein
MTAWETVVGFATNPGGAFTGLSYTAGQSGTVRNTDLASKVTLQDIWADGATAGVFRIRSPRLHDNVQGIRFQNAASQRNQLMGWWPEQRLVPQDALVAEITGGGAETDMGAYVIAYDSLPGADGQYAHWAQVQPRIRHIVTVEVATTASATVGNWSAGTAINATFDLTWANSWYAVLGYVVNAAVTCVAIQGPDTGSLKNGGPGSLNYVDTRNFFIQRDTFGGPASIPCFNSANKGGTFVFVADKAASTAVNVGLFVALLDGSSLPGA